MGVADEGKFQRGGGMVTAQAHSTVPPLSHTHLKEDLPAPENCVCVCVCVCVFVVDKLEHGGSFISLYTIYRVGQK